MTEQKEAVTFTERCRLMLDDQPDQKEFTLSRSGLETLVLDGERYAALNSVSNKLLLTAREIASNRTMRIAESNAFLRGHWDDSLPRVIRQIANHSLKTIEVLNRESEEQQQ